MNAAMVLLRYVDQQRFHFFPHGKAYTHNVSPFEIHCGGYSALHRFQLIFTWLVFHLSAHAALTQQLDQYQYLGNCTPTPPSNML